MLAKRKDREYQLVQLQNDTYETENPIHTAVLNNNVKDLGKQMTQKGVDSEIEVAALIKLAAQKNSQSTLLWLLSWRKQQEFDDADPKYMVEVYDCLIKKNNFEMANTIRGKNDFDLPSYLLERAAARGSIKQINHLKNWGCKWTPRASTAAAAYGQVDVLDWIVKNNQSLSQENLINAAVLNEKMEVMDWLYKNNYISIHNYEEIYKISVKNKKTKIVTWLRKNTTYQPRQKICCVIS